MNPAGHRRKVFSGLAQAIWRHRKRTLLATALLIAAKATAVAVPLVLKQVVDEFSRPEDMVTRLSSTAAATQAVLFVPVLLLLSYALLRFVSTLFTELRDLVFARVTQKVVTQYAEQAFGHLLALNPRFHNQRNTGSLIRDIERGTGGIGFLLGAGLFTIVPTLVEFGAVLVVMSSSYSLWFTLIIMGTFVLYAGYTTAMTQKREFKQRRVNEVDSTAHGRMVDGLMNYEAVKVHAREDEEQKRYAEVLRHWVEHSVSNQRALSALHIGQSAIIAVGVALMMLLAGEQVVRGELTVGDLVLVNAYVIQICLPLNALGFVFREARDALVNTEKLLDLLEQRPETEDRVGGPPLKVTGGEVVFDHVEFGYEPGRPILQGVSLRLGPGETLAVVGSSGSGKSTLARLLVRFYDVSGGRITVDGQDLRSVTMRSLRQAIGIVPQDTALFNDTIAYNIAYGRLGASLSEVIEAAKAAQVHEFIASLPLQYDTQVGERGTKLSGGEKQRIAIARAFLKNPPIMIFDEATSALDTRSERAIQVELNRIAQGRSTLIIAHRLSTIVDADHIIVMDKGRIVEQGRHGALLEQDGLYAQLWNLQRQQQQVERLERDLARQPMNLGVLLAGVVDGLQHALAARSIGLFSEVDLDEARITADPTTLSQVLHDLILRAIQCTPEGGRISLRLLRHEGLARVVIADGRQARSGLPAPSATGPDTTPLDPMAVRSSIESQGGRFSTEGSSATHGMCHILDFPLHVIGQPPGQATNPSPADATAHSLRGLHVMAVDDLPDALGALDLLLRLHGAEVELHATAASALSALQERPTSAWPHVLLCDIALGDDSGYDVIRHVRAIESQRNVALAHRLPAVALSGLAGSADRIHAMLSGFQAHLVKPVEPRELMQTLLSVTRSPPRA